jgi:hypothetical protein
MLPQPNQSIQTEESNLFSITSSEDLPDLGPQSVFLTILVCGFLAYLYNRNHKAKERVKNIQELRIIIENLNIQSVIQSRYWQDDNQVVELKCKLNSLNQISEKLNFTLQNLDQIIEQLNNFAHHQPAKKHILLDEINNCKANWLVAISEIEASDPTRKP